MHLRTRSAPVRLLSPVVRGVRESVRRAATLPFNHGLMRRVRPYTMCDDEDLLALCHVVREQASTAGAFVECGVWRGGSAFLMALADPTRTVWMFDSFEGLPTPTAEDGRAGVHWLAGPERRRLRNAAVAVDDVERWARRLGVRDRVEIVKGWFSDTLAVTDTGPIALLRLDADLYESTRDCLEALWDRVVPGGAVILDDYRTWEGCAAAVHEFLGTRRLGCPIMEIGRYNTLIRKP